VDQKIETLLPIGKKDDYWFLISNEVC